MKYDVVIVGARCAGAATALLLARAGLRVRVVDRNTHGSDTLSTHAIMRGGVMQMERWGLLPAIVAAGTPAVRSTRFTYGGGQDVTVAIEPKYGVEALYAPRRALLDRVLVDAAVESGAHVSFGARVDDLVIDDHGRVRGVQAAVGGNHERIEADPVVGADGLYSTVARRIDATITVEGRHAAAVLYSYFRGLPAEEYWWKFGPGVSMGAIPTNGGVSCVFASVPPQRFRAEVHGDPLSAFQRWTREAAPEFAARLIDSNRTEAMHGFGGHPGYIKQSVGPGWALVGDAGYFKDPATAHGITDALRDAELLARAVLKGTAAALTEYETARNELSRRLFEVTDEIASFASADDHLQSLHREFSREMSRENRTLAALEPLPCLSPLASAPPAV